MKKLILFLIIYAFYLSYSTELRIVSPNGGENFPKGGSIEIKWVGISDTTVVSIEYSTDKGISWLLITDSAMGLKYTWNDIPKLISNQYLLRIRQIKEDFSSSYTLEQTLETYSSLLILRWSPSGDRILAVNPLHENDSLWIWDIASGEQLINLKISDNSFHEVFWSPDGKQLATIVDEWHVKIWDSYTGSEIVDLGTKDFPQHVQWSPDGKRLAVGFDQGLRLYSPVTWTLAAQGLLNDNYFYNPSFIWSPDSKNIITIAPDSIYIINPSDVSVLNKFNCEFSDWKWQWYSDWDWGWGWGWGNNHKSGWCHNYFSHDGNYLAIPSKDSLIKVMDIKDGSIKFTFPWFEKYYDFFCWSTDDKRIITMGLTKPLSIWNGLNGANIITFPKIKSEHSFAMHPDGVRIATDNRDFSVQIWDITNGKSLQKLIGHKNEVMDYEWSPDGKRIATFSEDKTIKIWYLESLYLQEDISDNTWAVVMPELASKDIDMGKVLIEFSKDSLFEDFIINTGKCQNNLGEIYLEGPDKDMFSVESLILPKNILPGETMPLKFTFKPTSIGKKTAEVVIVSFADTLRQMITGEGVYPDIRLVNNNVDFGKVMVNKSKDSLVLLLSNKSPQQVRIDSVRLVGGNANQFDIPNNIPFFIKSNEQKMLWLRFMPEQTGILNTGLNFYFNGPDSPIQINLKGEGIFSAPDIQVGTIKINELICESQTVSSFPITNVGLEDLIIYGATISGTNFEEFSVEPVFSKMTIVAGETQYLKIKFKPAGTGLRTAYLELKSNSFIDSIYVVQLISRKDSISIEPETQKINLGFLCPGEATDTLFQIMNRGTRLTGGYAAATSGISLTNSEFVVDTEKSIPLTIHYYGNPEEGIFSEFITITDSVCGYSRTVEITGEISKPAFEVEIPNFSALKGKYIDKKVKITNNGNRELLIPYAPVITPPFELIDNPFPMIIPDGESKEFTIRFTASDTLETGMTFTLNAEPCGVETGFTLTGSGLIARAKLRAGNAEGYAGDIVEIPVYLVESENISLTLSAKFNTDLLFNSTLLSPLSHQLTLLNDNTGSVTLKDLPLNGIAGEEIARIKFITALGNSEYSTVYFSNIVSDGGDIDFDTVSGSFRLLGICKDGGSRLINNSGTEQLISIKPNPADETIEIEMELLEAGENRLYISDLIGNEVKTFFNGFINTFGIRKIKININELAAGVYFVILQTPTDRQSVMMLKN